MSKRFKLKFPSVINSLQFCRFKNPSSYPENPKPSIYRLSPVNPKAFDIGYPSNLPAPPPSTPDYSFVMRQAAASSKIKSDGCGSCARSRSCAQYLFSDCSTELPCCNVKTSSFSVAEKDYIKKKNKEKKKSKASNNYRTSSGSVINSFSSNDYDEDEDSLVLLDSSRSFSNEVPDESIHSFGRKEEKKKKLEDLRIRSLKRQSSKNRKGTSYGGSSEHWTTKTASSWTETEVVVGNKNNKVRESVAVVKKSEDPYEDFKRSMLEMIMEKQMFEASDLEELLQCFLTLNSRQYHGVIVEAFSEIWEILFCDSPVKHRLSF